MNPNQAAQLLAPPAPSEFRDRLVPLCDGRRGLRAALQIEAQPQPGPSGQAPPGAKPLPVVDFISSDATLDRYDEIILPEGWHLENYRRNPVFQNAHQYGDIIFTLGKALITEVRALPSPHLFQRVEFAVDVNPMARIAYGLYKNKFLNAVSVGFIPIRWENGDGTQHASRKEAFSSQPSSPEEERERRSVAARFLASEKARSEDSPGRQVRRRYLEQELLEVSAVGIPANPEALQLGLKAGAVERTDLKELVDLLLANAEPNVKHPEDHAAAQSRSPSSIIDSPSSPPSPFAFNSNTAAANTHACAPGARGNGAQLLSLARALRDLLRRT
jgi:hypothetical protein